MHGQGQLRQSGEHHQQEKGHLPDGQKQAGQLDQGPLFPLPEQAQHQAEQEQAPLEEVFQEGAGVPEELEGAEGGPQVGQQVQAGDGKTQQSEQEPDQSRPEEGGGQGAEGGSGAVQNLPDEPQVVPGGGEIGGGGVHS